MRPFLLLLAVALSTTQAASMTFVSEVGTYWIAMPGEFSECSADEDRAICKVGDYFMEVGPNGCEDSIGPGYCSQLGNEDGIVANELYCKGKQSYQLSTGSHPARCKSDSAGKHCRSLDGEHEVAASCAYGCGDSSGAGSCRAVPNRSSAGTGS